MTDTQTEAQTDSGQGSPEGGAEPVETMESLMANEQAYEDSFKSVKQGQFLTGKVVRIDAEGVFLDVGYKTEGFVPLSQLTHRKDVTPGDVVAVGDEIDVEVTKVDGHEGQLMLSKKRADVESAWIRVLKAQESNETLTATCTEQVKGGLIVDLGLRGFVPASHVDMRPVHDLSDFVGEPLELKVIEVDRARRKVVLSRKKALEEQRSQLKERTFNEVEEGQILQGQVARLTNFGAFINLGGIDGLVHISELAWRRVKHPSEVVKIGETVEVRVLGVQKDRERISLSVRQARPDPWASLVQAVKVGDIVPGKISKLAKNYLFVEIADGIEGLVPMDELSDQRISRPGDKFRPEQDVQVKVLEIRPESRRVLLSIRQASDNPDSGSRERHVSSKGGDSNSGFTIGDRLQEQLKHLMKPEHKDSDGPAKPKAETRAEPKPEAKVEAPKAEAVEPKAEAVQPKAEAVEPKAEAVEPKVEAAEPKTEASAAVVEAPAAPVDEVAPTEAPVATEPAAAAQGEATKTE